MTISTQPTKNLQDLGKVYHVANIAFYTTENLTAFGTPSFWISWVLATLNVAKELTAADPSCSHVSGYAGIPQKWMVYHSVPIQEQQEEIFEKWLKRDSRMMEPSLQKLGARVGL
jgi:transposase